MSLISWYRERQLKKLKLKRPSAYLGWDQVRTIGLYYEVRPDSETEIEAWSQFFREHGKEVAVLAYQPIKRKNLDPNWQRLTVCKSDSNWWGMPNHPDFKSFEAKNFEVFIDLSKGEEAVHQIIGRRVKAQIKVGFIKSKTNWADLIIDCEKAGQSSRCREEVLALLKFINA